MSSCAERENLRLCNTSWSIQDRFALSVGFAKKIGVKSSWEGDNYRVGWVWGENLLNCEVVLYVMFGNKSHDLGLSLVYA